jgi:large subunit ribosomal protein L35
MKLKTHKGAAKRFKVTGGGKITRHQAFARHILTKKSASRKRHLGKRVSVSDGDTPKVRLMLPYA